MAETEITVEVFEDIKTVTSKLKSMGFKMIEKYKINDYYFSKYSTKQLKQFDYASLIKNSFLVRDIVDNNPKVLLTYKDKTLDDLGNVISEQKVVTKVSDLHNTLKILELAGLNCYTELFQTMWVFKRDNIEFILQEAKNLGNYIEYEETEELKNLTEQQKIDLMLKTLKSLGLNLGADYSVKKVYLKFLKENK